MFASVFVVLCCLFYVCSGNDAASLESMIAADPSKLNAKGSGGQTPLMSAVLSGKTKSVEFLLKAGADVNIPEQDGYTPMVCVYPSSSSVSDGSSFPDNKVLSNSTEPVSKEGPTSQNC